MSVLGGAGGMGGAGRNDKSLAMPLLQMLKLAWADDDLRSRLLFILMMFAVYAFGVHVAVPIPGVDASRMEEIIQNLPGLGFYNQIGGGALKKISIFALGLAPYITASIILQILTTAYPQWKKELQEGGEYARRQQNKRTRLLTLFLCGFQGFGLLGLMHQALPPDISLWARISTVVFWTAGSMFMLWVGEQISEKGIGNGISIMIFAGIVISLPGWFDMLYQGFHQGSLRWYQVLAIALTFLATTWLVVLFTVAQRRIPIQHMRRMTGTRMVGGQTSYLPFSLNMVGVIPIIFASSLLYMPAQFSLMFGGERTPIGSALSSIQNWISPMSPGIQGVVGALFFTLLIFFFSYFYTAVQFNVDDISDNLKRGGSFIPGVRPGKQTKDFLDGILSRITFVGASFIAIVALMQYLLPKLTQISPQYVNVVSGTSLLILVSVALETMRQIEANLLMKQYDQ